MRKIACLAGLLVMAGCAPVEVRNCEDLIKARLRSPSSYKRIDYDTVPSAAEQFVSVYYDADNAYGAAIRYRGLCTFPVRDGRISSTANAVFDGSEAAALDEALGH